MAVGGSKFVITERKRDGTGAYIDTSRRFEWSALEKSSPRGSWRFGIEQRTVREDYPGNVEPTEQVLGWNFQPFTLKGIWDDRHMGDGKALETYQAFEKFVKAGPLCRLEFESISVTGIIKKLEVDYKRADYIGYEFEVSPHTRPTDPQRTLSSTQIKSPVPFNAKAFALSNDLMLSMDAFPKTWLRVDLFLALLQRLEDLQRLVQAITDVIDNRFLESISPSEAMSRIVNAFVGVRLEAADILLDLNDYDATTCLIPTNGAAVLEYEVWERGLAYNLRLIIAQCLAAEEGLRPAVTPKTAALYRPQQGESLYAVSNRFYGTPFGWRTIMQANGIESTTLTGTELLLIPELGR